MMLNKQRFHFNRVNEYLVRLYNNYYCTIHNVLLDVKLTLAALFIFPFYILTVYVFFGRLRKLTRERSQALAEVQGFLHERVQGISVVKSFAIEDNEAKTLIKRTLIS